MTKHFDFGVNYSFNGDACFTQIQQQNRPLRLQQKLLWQKITQPPPQPTPHLTEHPVQNENYICMAPK